MDEATQGPLNHALKFFPFSFSPEARFSAWQSKLSFRGRKRMDLPKEGFFPQNQAVFLGKGLKIGWEFRAWPSVTSCCWSPDRKYWIRVSSGLSPCASDSSGQLAWVWSSYGQLIHSVHRKIHQSPPAGTETIGFRAQSKFRSTDAFLKAPKKCAVLFLVNCS